MPGDLMKEMEKALGLVGGINSKDGAFKPQDPAVLREMAERYLSPNTFKPGDLVNWKPGLKNKKGEGPFVVIQVLEEPATFMSEEARFGPGSPLFRENLDLKIGQICPDGDFEIYHHDSNRMMHYK
jgi:hypothetical protein